jgi:hypothetical protein
MKESYRSLVWSSFKQVNGPIASALSIPSAILVWIYLPTQNVPLSYIVIFGYFVIIIIYTLIETTHKLFEANKVELPRIINSKRDQTMGNIICVLEPSNLFSQGILVSFYYVSDDEFEICIGTGKVILIHRDGKVQVSLERPTSGYEEILEGFGNNNENIKKRIYIKPNILNIQ